MARQLCEGNRSGLSALALNKRPYLGTTSMDPELCMLMVNQAVLTPGSLAMDPFVGTASILIPMAKEGAFSFGFEIDPRIVRGCGRSLATNKRKRCGEKSHKSKFFLYMCSGDKHPKQL